MTISSTNRKAGPYSGNGVTTALPFSFKVFTAADVRVVRTDLTGVESDLTLTTHYTVALNADQDRNPGGTVNLVTAAATGYLTTLTSQVGNLQPVVLTNAGGFYPTVINTALDRLTIMVQQLAEKAGRALQYSISSSLGDAALPSPVPNNIIGWNSTANGFQNYPPSDNSLLSVALSVDTGASLIGSNDGAGGTKWTTVAGFIAKLLSSSGASIVGFSQVGSGAVSDTIQGRIRYLPVTVEGFMTLADRTANYLAPGSVDVTYAVQAAITQIATQQGYQTILGAVPGGYVSNAYALDLGASRYKISAALTCPSYFKVVAQNAVIVQTDPTKDIFSGATAYQWDISGVSFSGGRHHLYLENANLDVTRWSVRNCTFSLSSNYAIKTWPTGGATSHLSANLTIAQCAFYKPKQALLNYCDSAIVEDSWLFVSKDNFTANSAVFVNASTTTDGHPHLYLRNMFGVPSMGKQGVDRLAQVRWVDHNAGSIHGLRCRFGGEFAGMPIVYTYALPNTTYPYIGPSIHIDDSEIYAGPSAANDSAVVVLNGKVPQRISITNCKGPLEVPYIINYGGQIANFSTYFAAFETATSQKAYTQFRVKIDGNDSLNPDGSIYSARVPLGLRPYVNNFRQTKVHRAATQTINNAFANNLVSFDTVDYDTQGGFAIANPTRIVMPSGATKMRIQVFMSLNGGFTGNTLSVRIVDSALGIIASQSIAQNINADNTAYTVSADVDAVSGSYFHINVQCNTAGNQTMTSCVVTATALDYIG